MTNPTTLLFDLGGVIVPWVGIEALMARTGLSREAVSTRMSESKIFSDYEIGACSDETFCAELVGLFDLDIPLGEAPLLWNSWVHPPFPGVIDALAKLRSTHRVACLSNTNALHWAHLQTLLDLEEAFHHPLASHLLKAAKPGLEIYQRALDLMGVSAKDVHFFDDTLVNVEAARALGMRATHVDRAVGVMPTLKQLDLV